MKFEEAVKLLKKGKYICREDNENNSYYYMVDDEIKFRYKPLNKVNGDVFFNGEDLNYDGWCEYHRPISIKTAMELIVVNRKIIKEAHITPTSCKIIIDCDKKDEFKSFGFDPVFKGVHFGEPTGSIIKYKIED